MLYRSLILFICLSATPFSGQSQTYGDKEFYLIDSLNLDELTDWDRRLIDSLLTNFHGTDSVLLQLREIRVLVNAIMTPRWEDYNHFAYTFSREIINNSTAYTEEILSEARRNLAGSINNKGFAAGVHGNSTRALEYYEQSLKIAEKFGDSSGIAMAYLNISSSYKRLGDLETANLMQTEGIRISTAIADLRLMATGHMNIGFNLHTLKLYEESLENFNIALKYAEAQTVDEALPAKIYSGMASAYVELGIDSLAEKYARMAVSSMAIFGTWRGVVSANNEYVDFYIYKARKARTMEEDFQSFIDSAKVLNKKSIEIAKQNNLERYLVDCYIHASYLAEMEGELLLAIGYFDSASALSEVRDQLLDKRNVAELGYKIFKAAGKSDLALEQLERFLEIRAELNYDESRRKNESETLRIKHERAAAADSVKFADEQELAHARLALSDAQIKADKKQKWFLYAGLVLVGLFGFFMYNRFKVTSRQKHLIENQKQNIEEAHEEIKASISYAQRLQSAILPSQETLDTHLGESFVMFRPKDVVSGDFYWLRERDGIVLFAAADCTGHGVPGAMVSLVCSNTLTRCVKEFGMTDPGEILDKTRLLVIEAFEAGGQDVYDGMDLALCAFNTRNRTLQYAGANNPIWIVSEGESKDEKVFNENGNNLKEYRADKQPIGRYQKMSTFTTKDIPVKSGDTVYVFSDGYADQFGGEKGKKLKYKPLKKLILNSMSANMDEQLTSLNQSFDQWRGDYEQVDDICMIGVRIQ